MQLATFVEGLRSAELADSFLATCAGASIPPGTVHSLHQRRLSVSEKTAEFARLKTELNNLSPPSPDAISEVDRQIAALQRERVRLRDEADLPRVIASKLQVIVQVVHTFCNDQFVAQATLDERRAAGAALLLNGEQPLAQQEQT
jgi:hypothetical protein